MDFVWRPSKDEAARKPGVGNWLNPIPPIPATAGGAPRDID